MLAGVPGACTVMPASLEGCGTVGVRLRLKRNYYATASLGRRRVSVGAPHAVAPGQRSWDVQRWFGLCSDGWRRRNRHSLGNCNTIVKENGPNARLGAASSSDEAGSGRGHDAATQICRNLTLYARYWGRARDGTESLTCASRLWAASKGHLDRQIGHPTLRCPSPNK